jgi:hypothetical protein
MSGMPPGCFPAGGVVVKRYLIAPLIIVLLLFGWVGQAMAAPPASSTAENAAGWLRGQQQPDGGFPGFQGGSDPSATADAAVAFAAAGIDPASVKRDGHSIIDFLTASAGSYGTSVAGAAKLTLAAVAAGENPREFGGVNLISQLQSHLDQAGGLYDEQIFTHAYAMLALVAAGETVPSNAITALEHHQAADGSWSFSGSTDPEQGDSNTTAIAVQALNAAHSGNSAPIEKAFEYLKTVRMPDGSYTYQPGGASPPAGDANSTALVIQALIAAGRAPETGVAGSPLDALVRFQNQDGAFRFRDDTPADSALATVQAIPALMFMPLPIVPSGFSQADPPAILPAAGQAHLAPAAPALLSMIGLGLLLMGAGLRRGLGSAK